MKDYLAKRASEHAELRCEIEALPSTKIFASGCCLDSKRPRQHPGDAAVAADETFNGKIVALSRSTAISIGAAITDLQLLALTGSPEELEGQVLFLPF